MENMSSYEYNYVWIGESIVHKLGGGDSDISIFFIFLHDYCVCVMPPAEQLEEDQQRNSGLLRDSSPPLARLLQSSRPHPHRSGSHTPVPPFHHDFIHQCFHSTSSQ